MNVDHFIDRLQRERIELDKIISFLECIRKSAAPTAKTLLSEVRRPVGSKQETAAKPKKVRKTSNSFARRGSHGHRDAFDEADY